MRYLHWTNGPGMVWTRETIFVRIKFEKMSGILRQWPLSLHRKSTKLLDMALTLPISKIEQKNTYFITIVPADIFFL